MELITSVRRGCDFNLYFLEFLVINPFKLISLDVLSESINSNVISEQHWMKRSFSGAIFGLDLITPTDIVA
ncbi:hypothetical protein WICPIJ_000098 [Wickerhamomyces pijperi]|uniref:Uncharacterized protein n=1 Tax=Wickerhamomyces pijperi TaxID=599730 RepID=A0A9P8TSD8_WICPI|nr:hypothetical protein WICPIJ_000098 [Wickerhamomyces pijperi]